MEYGPAMMRMVLAISALSLGCPGASPPVPTSPGTLEQEVEEAPPPARLAVSALPGLDRWTRHIDKELMSFWAAPGALGQPVGNFPTFLCNDGSAYDAGAPCKEMTELPGWLSQELTTTYTRMKSRQAFTYGVAFHVTGDQRYLTYARAGVEWLRQNAYQRDTGSAITYWRDGVAGPPAAQRTTQDLAYAQLGLAFYYYLTRDPEVLDDMTRLREHVMREYWDESWGMLRWVREDGDAADGDDTVKKELVAQLDQINAYLLLVSRIAPEGPEAGAWKRDLRTLARVVKERFFAPEYGMFWGVVHDPAEMKLGGRHVDFGHSIKALWMIYLTGQLFDDGELVEFARQHAGGVLERAALESGCWASGYTPEGVVVEFSQWWIHAELDQAAATFALREKDHERYSRYLGKSYECWLTRFVDRKGGGVWPFVPPDWTEDIFAERQPIKAHQWKSGYHAAEHGLVSLLTTAGLTGQKQALYFAFKQAPEPGGVHPYLLEGTIVAQEDVALPGHADLRGVRVVFEGIR